MHIDIPLKTDSSLFAQSIYSALAADERFNSLFLPVVDRYLASEGIELADYEGPSRRSVTFDRVMDIATRFFYPTFVQDGRIVSHVCVGVNGVRDLQGGRDLMVEAFAYTSIFHDLLSPKYHVRKDFNEAKQLIQDMDLSSDEPTRLTRAQGVMWAYMRESQSLERVLLSGYQAMQDFLPFRIEDS